ncbi:MAG: ankyrin repeat domain-containing protein, partial [Planctomycetota bacterium]
MYDVREQMAMHRTIEIVQQHWKEMTGLKPPAEEPVSGQVQDMGQSSDKTESLPVPSPDDPHLATALARARQATVAVEESGVSGVLVTPDGYVVTCAHHRDPRGTVVTIHLADGRAVQGKMLGRHPLLDIGLAKVTEPGPWPHTQLGSAAALKPGDLCLAFGYPSSDPDGVRRPRWQEAIVRVGRIRDTSSATEELRTSCGSMGGGGYSGGGLFDAQGRLIGVHQGPGRHSSIDLVKKYWDLLVKGSSVEDPVPFDRSPTAGAFRKAVQNIPPITVEVLGDQRRRALGTIVSGDGYVLTKASELRGSISCRLADGRTLPATVAKVAPQNDLALLKIEATSLPRIPWSRREDVPVGSFVGALRHGEPAVVGAVAIPTRAIARAPGWLVLGKVKDAKGGVEVVELRGIWRSHTPLREGDVIVHVAGHPTPNVKTFEELTRKSEVGVPFAFAGDPIRVGVRRDGKDMELRFPLLSPTHDAFGTTSLRNSGFPAVFDTDAIIRKDSCGGPVVDRSGEVVGITIAMPTEQRVYVVPATIARNVAEGKEAAGIPGVSIGSAAGPPTLDEIKTRLKQQRSKIESLYVQTKTEYKSPFSAEELQEIHVGGSDLGLAREHYCAFKGLKRYYRYVELYGDISPLPPEPELPDDATAAEKAAHKWKVDQRKRFEEEASWLPRTVCTRMDHARGFNGKMLWERTASDRTHPDGRVERGVPSVDSHIVNRTPWVPSGEYLYWLGWVTVGEDLATVSTAQADVCYLGSLPALLERWSYSMSQATEVIDGAKCVVLTGVIERTVGTGHVVKRNDKLWLDLDHGLALRKREWKSEAGGTVFRQVTSNWQEFALGFWLPAEIEIQTIVPPRATRYAEKYRDRVVLSRHVTLVQCIVNQVEDDLFEVPVKPGDQVEDPGAKATIEGGDTSTKSLHKAAAEGNIGQVKSLISQGADVNTNDKKGRTPLHFAAEYGYKDVAELLIAKGANIDAISGIGLTALHRAALGGHKGVVELLIAKDADVNAKNMRNKMTALHYA